MRRSLMILLLFAGCKSSATATPNPGQPEPVHNSRATRVEIAQLHPSVPKLELRLPGEVEGARDSELASTLGGYVEKVFVHAGDEVKAGAPIAWINKGVQDANLAQAKAMADLRRGERDRTASAGTSVSKARRDQAEFQYQSANAAYRLASIYARSATVRAPFDGVIAKLFVEEGEVVSPGGEVARLVQLNPVLVTLTVADRDVVNLRTGLDVSVTTTARPRVFPGKLLRITPAANIETRAFDVDVSVDNADRQLLPGMIAKVHVSVEQKDEALTIPQYVLVTRKDTNGVFIVKDSVAHWREVELGLVIRDQVIVLSGIEPDEHVVVTGHRELVDQDPVIIQRTGDCCTGGRVIFHRPQESASAP